MSPFVGNFELQAHATAGNSTALLDLCRLQWGFMLDDPRMTNSTFIEGYSTNGDLHYAPYTNDPRVSHAHGWSTGPTSALSFYVAGINLVAAGGQEWKIAPRLGDLTEVDAGFSTSIGFFSAKTKKDTKTGGLSIEFQAPEGTEGSVSIEYPKCKGTLTLRAKGCEDVTVKYTGDASSTGTLDIAGLAGKTWHLSTTCS